MSTRKQDRAIQNFPQWLLRALIVTNTNFSESGFVLPTVVMVSMVVVLLTTAIMVRSFDRSRNASNVRVNQVVLNAATPALDRARAKIDELFKDPTLPKITPTDAALYASLNRNRYTFGDETQLKLVHDLNQSGTIQTDTTTENNEITTVWKFPVDTDNNGLFDSFTLYGIYFRNPPRGIDGKFIRSRSPLEGRTSPLDQAVLGGQCAAALGNKAQLVGDSDWYKSGSKLTKSFFVYTATVPINDISSLNREQYEQYKGNRGFSALELQQDRDRLPLNNNAVWYEDDLEVSEPTTTVRVNGRVFTNSNLMVAGSNSANKTIFYQVSDPDSCYYEQENSKIVVAGNVANGDIRLTTDKGEVEVHRFQGKGVAPTGQYNPDEGINNTNKTTTQNGGRWVGYNNAAYGKRISLLVEAALALHLIREKPYPTIASVSAVARYPQEVKERFKQRLNDPNETATPQEILTEELETYFKAHTRRFTYAESNTTTETVLGNYNLSNVLGETNPIKPPDNWMAIEDPINGSTSGYTNLPLNFSINNTMNLRATEPTQQQKDGKEYFIGDRILVGNNLPFLWPKYTTGIGLDKLFDEFAQQQEKQLVKNYLSDIYWNNPNNGNASNTQRTRQSQIQFLPELAKRDSFWEKAATKQPAINENTGGLRVITGTGIYVDGDALTGAFYARDTNSFLPNPALNSGINEPPQFETDKLNNNQNIIVWSDTMPMRGGAEEIAEDDRKGDLQMRATAVYHYKHSDATTSSTEVDLNQAPIACVSSYYDPTDKTTARNQSGLPDVSGISDTNSDGIINSSDKLADGSNATNINNNDGRSNNGVTYETPYTNDLNRITAVDTYRDQLDRQARMIFSNGRIVNEPLRKALEKIDAREVIQPRSLADNAAIDTAICAVKILDGTLRVQTVPNIPHGAIKEVTFLDSRQVKSLNSSRNSDGSLDNTRVAERQADLTTSYTLPLEQRQPLEIRVTELDLNLLKTKEIRLRPIDTQINNINNDPDNEQEYLLPNSGIIYASRDDALPDLSDNSNDLTTQKLVNSADFKLDSTRRPNGIRLINGANLARKNFYRTAEQGLILATNLPVYIKGNFNLHEDPNPSNFTIKEEFTDKLNLSDWSDFYSRDNTRDASFACRQYQPGCADSGDGWRPATVISDAQTLLSNNFWDGFRNQGDYDLNNNQGNSVVSSRKKQGFWHNNFVTSTNWVGADSYPAVDNKNSYLLNGVTPIQRRTGFPEYVMEICRKLPVSECQVEDWVVGYDVNGDGNLSNDERSTTAYNLPTVVGDTATFNPNVLARLGAGTTARAALEPEDRRYARRVAFARDSDGRLSPQVIGSNNLVKPLGAGCPLTGCEYPDNRAATPGVNYGIPANNALWFRATTNQNGQPYNDTSYRSDQPLAYENIQLFSPPTPDIPGVPSLNLPANNPASGYTVCTNQSRGSSKKAIISALNEVDLAECSREPGNPVAQVDAVRNALLDTADFNPEASPTDAIVRPTAPNASAEAFTAVPGATTTFTSPAQSVVNVIDINGNFATTNTGPTVIELVGNKNSIFVFRKNSDLIFLGGSSNQGVEIGIRGVNPNNVFWAINGNVQWNQLATNQRHEMAGTFIINSSSTFQLTNVEFPRGKGGRLLGSNTIQINPNSQINAIASADQPPLIPVLQIHSPTGNPNTNPFAGLLEAEWLQQATATTANATFITGDSPSRPNPSESGGGLHNLVRFLENWSGQIARISGSFMQYRRSLYASAPFNPVDPTVTDASASLFYTLSGDQAIYRYGSDTGFRYRGGEFERRAPFFMQPTRAYMFDVAILSQSFDLFAQRFTLNSTSLPSEYFREVGRDDAWVQTLLCAAQGEGTNYSYAVDADERPNTCQPLTSYNDAQPSNAN